MKTILEWTYNPTSYFDKKITESNEFYAIEIDNGKAVAEIQTDYFEKKPNIREEITNKIETQFQADQLLHRKEYELTYSLMKEIDSDGKSKLSIELRPEKVGITCQTEITVTNKAGKITYDSRKERKGDEKLFKESIISACSHDQLSKKLLDSYQASIKEPENELVRLYEIRDALSNEYGGDKNAKETLDISDKKWSQFGKLCNHEPLMQGRHKGKHLSQLREASKLELMEARKIAKELLLAHFKKVNNSD